jgi:hypothetical protein
MSNDKKNTPAAQLADADDEPDEWCVQLMGPSGRE